MALLAALNHQISSSPWPAIFISQETKEESIVAPEDKIIVGQLTAITMQKAFGQTFKSTGVGLWISVFMRGILYVAFFQVKRQYWILLPPENSHHSCSVVWKEILNTTEVNPNVTPMELDYKESSTRYPDNMENFSTAVKQLQKRTWRISLS